MQRRSAPLSRCAPFDFFPLLILRLKEERQTIRRRLDGKHSHDSRCDGRRSDEPNAASIILLLCLHLCADWRCSNVRQGSLSVEQEAFPDFHFPQCLTDALLDGCWTLEDVVGFFHGEAFLMQYHFPCQALFFNNFKATLEKEETPEEASSPRGFLLTLSSYYSLSVTFTRMEAFRFSHTARLCFIAPWWFALSGALTFTYLTSCLSFGFTSEGFKPDWTETFGSLFRVFNYFFRRLFLPSLGWG